MAKGRSKMRFRREHDDKFHSKGPTPTHPENELVTLQVGKKSRGRRRFKKMLPKTSKRKRVSLNHCGGRCGPSRVRVASKEGGPLRCRKRRGALKFRKKKSKIFTCGTGAGGPRPTASLVIDKGPAASWIIGSLFLRSLVDPSCTHSGPV